MFHETYRNDIRYIKRTTKKLGKPIPLASLKVIRCFHVSYLKNRESILTYGLIPKAKPAGELISYEARIFLSVTYEEAAFDYVNFEHVDVWSFYLPMHLLFEDEFSDYHNHYYTKEPVPWYKLTLMESL
jgi:hypothetical protein